MAGFVWNFHWDIDVIYEPCEHVFNFSDAWWKNCMLRSS